MTENGSEQPEGIVLLLRKPRNLSVRALADVLSDVTGRPVCAIDADDPSEEKDRGKPMGDFWVAGAAPHFIIQAAGISYVVHNLSAPYMDDPERAAAEAPELRLRRAIIDHTAWLSMDVLRPEEANPEAYRLIIGVLARLSDPDCLAVYHPPTNRFIFSLSDKESARGAADPVEALFEMADEVPVIPIEDDDPRMKAAEEEARRRFPEFEEAFRAKTSPHFAVKTTLSGNGNREHLWVTVEEIQDGKIKGKVGNDPVDLGDWKLGSPVELAVSEVEDWIYIRKRFLRKAEPVGGFTMTAIAKIQRERSAG